MDMATRAPMRRIRSSSSSSSFRHRTSASPSELPLEAVEAGDDAPLAFARLPLPPLPLLRGGRSASSRAANARDGPTRLPPAPPTIPSEQLFRNRADDAPCPVLPLHEVDGHDDAPVPVCRPSANLDKGAAARMATAPAGPTRSTNMAPPTVDRIKVHTRRRSSFWPGLGVKFVSARRMDSPRYRVL